MCNIKLIKAQLGDEDILAHIQTESWKAAFSDIITTDEITRCTKIEKCVEMYRKVLANSNINVWLEFVDEKAHCIAAWSQNRCNLGDDVSELICIHSLKDRWRKGYGSVMMNHILGEIKQSGYSKVILWVFEKNDRARKFYEKHGFVLTEEFKLVNGVKEIMYAVSL